MNRSIYTLIVVIAVGTACGRIASVQLLYEPSGHRNDDDPPGKRLWPKRVPRAMPTFGSNDRSRWATIRALVENRTYVIGERDPAAYRASAMALLGQLDPWQATTLARAGYEVRVRSNRGILFEDGYQSIDAVLHPEKLEFYSSKPPLFTTLVAGLYWLLNAIFGWTMTTHPNAVVRTILILVNVVPFAAYLHIIAGWLERWAVEAWTRMFVLAVAAFATLVSPFLITLNNHTLGTFAVLFALHALMRIWEARTAGQEPHAGWFVVAGTCAAFAVAMELPALAFAGCIGALLLAWSPVRTVMLALPMAALIAAAFFGTNYLAVGQLRPAYSEFGGPWYEYEGSHWRRPLEGEKRRGIDWAHQHESRAVYAMHVLVGHHGWFSLTPVWLLALAGMVCGCWTARSAGPDDEQRLPWVVPPLALLVSFVVIGFYVGVVGSANYGGFTVGLRWLMWLTPLWLVCLIPVADALANLRAGRGLAYVLLGVSVLSANYSLWNPWRHPWLYDLMVALGWPGY